MMKKTEIRKENKQEMRKINPKVPKKLLEQQRKLTHKEIVKKQSSMRNPFEP